MWVGCFFALALILLLGSVASAIRVYTAHPDKNPTYPAGLAPADAPILDSRRRDFALCVRFRFFALRKAFVISGGFPYDDPTVISIFDMTLLANSNSRSEDVEDANWMSVSGDWFLVRKLFVPNVWYHYCMSYDHNSRRVTAVVNGEVVVDKVDKKMRSDRPPPEVLQNIWFGKDSSRGFGTGNSITGELSDANGWDRTNTLDFMVGWTSCDSMGGGTAFNWDGSQFNILNMTEREATKDELCTPEVPGWTIMPTRRSMFENLDVCHAFRADMLLPKSTEEVVDMLALLPTAPSCGYRLAVAAWDYPQEGNFTNANDGTPITFSNWGYNFPDGQRVENCAVVDRNRFWNDLNCHQKLCTVCDFGRVPNLGVRGMCRGSTFDRYLAWTREIAGGRYAFQGWMGSGLRYNDTAREWTMTSASAGSAAFAFCNETDEYPLGRHKWYVRQEPCYNMEPVEIELKISACEPDEFSCDDGQCVSMAERCNRREDCADNSDELGCNLVVTDDTYLKEYPPLGRTGSIRIVQDVNIYTILDLNEVAGTFQAQFDLILRWYDPRLEMHNLKDVDELNMLSRAEQNSIWVPVLTFDNTEKKDFTLNDELSYVIIQREGNQTRSKSDHLENIYIYEGADNALRQSRIYNNKFICVYYLREYPFDVQQCQLRFSMKGNLGAFVDLVPGALNYFGNVDLAIYYVKRYSMRGVTREDDGTLGIDVDIVFGRRLLAIVLTTYFPTIMLILIVLATHYYRTQYFEARVTVNVTVMLVMTTLYVGTSNSLPATAYTKSIDVWMIFCQAIPFLEVVVQTLAEYIRIEDKEENVTFEEEQGGGVTRVQPINAGGQMPAGKGKRKGRGGGNWRHGLHSAVSFVGRTVVPVGVAAFIVVYFIYGVVAASRDSAEDIG